MFTLAIVGRPNVGKSTLFNRLAGKKLAIVNDTPGITRDWREAEGSLMDIKLRLIDTAGLEDSFDDSIEGRMRRQTESALAEADAILFMIDGRAGLTPLDIHFAGWLRKQKMPVILGINKCESDKAAVAGIAEAYSLGLGNPIAMSAEHNIGFGELYEELEKHLPADVSDENNDDTVDTDLSDEELDALDGLEGREDNDFMTALEQSALEAEKKPIKLAIVGRPNAGKSTLMNSIVGEHRVMTGPEAGITRDAIAVHWTYEGKEGEEKQDFRLVDTAGLRRRARINDEIEKMSVDDAFRAIRLAQVVILVLDASLTIQKQDLTIADHVLAEGRALIIAVNKWDEAKDKEEIMGIIHDRLERSLAQVKNIPIVNISALTGKNINVLMRIAVRTFKLWNARVPTAGLNRWLGIMESQHPAPLVSGRQNRLKYITQIKTRPPTFAMWMSRPTKLAESYKRYIVNGLREEYNIPGVPIRLHTRTSKNPYTDKS